MKGETARITRTPLTKACYLDAVRFCWQHGMTMVRGTIGCRCSLYLELGWNVGGGDGVDAWGRWCRTRLGLDYFRDDDRTMVILLGC